MFETFRPARPQSNGMFKEISVEDALAGSTRDDEGARLKALAIGPGHPGWRAKIQPPEPDGTETQLPPEEDLTQNILDRMRQMAPPPPATTLSPATHGGRRVAFYFGQGTNYVICVESLPEWDTVKRFKLTEPEARAVFQVCQAIGVKTKDITGDFDDGELGENNAPAPTRARRGRPRRKEDEAAVPGADQQAGGGRPDGAAA